MLFKEEKHRKASLVYIWKKRKVVLVDLKKNIYLKLYFLWERHNFIPNWFSPFHATSSFGLLAVWSWLVFWVIWHFWTRCLLPFVYALNVSEGMDILVRFRLNLPLLLNVLPWVAAFCFSVLEEHHVGGNENEAKPAGFLNELRQENCFGALEWKDLTSVASYYELVAKPQEDCKNFESSSFLVATWKKSSPLKAWRIILNMLLC